MVAPAVMPAARVRLAALVPLLNTSKLPAAIVWVYPPVAVSPKVSEFTVRFPERDRLTHRHGLREVRQVGLAVWRPTWTPV